MFYVYILHLKKVDKLYTGYTSNLKKRTEEHIRNKVLSTKYKDPVLIHYECYKIKSDASRREKFLKTTEGKRLLRQQIKDLLKEIVYSGIV